MEYIVIADTTYPVDTPEQIAEAQTALRDAGEERADVWTTPADLASIEEHGDPDGYKNGQTLFA